MPYAPPPDVRKLVTGAVWGDITLGIVLTLVSMFVGGLGLLVMPIVYILTRANYPIFGRSIGYTYLLVIVLVLGALALCFYGLQRL